MCVNPLTIKHGDTRYIVPCGTCYDCQIRRRAEWASRNQIELKYSSRAYFCTLTYDDDYLLGNLRYNSLVQLFEPNKLDYQRFLKRLRKDYDVRYFLVHEYGTQTLRPHYHVILYFADDVDFKMSDLRSYWHYGLVTVDRVNNARIHYMTKYLIKDFRKKFGSVDYWLTWYRGDIDSARPYLRQLFIKRHTFNAMSTRPAIGHQLLDDKDMIDYIRNTALREDKYPSLFVDGMEFPLPRYYVKKIFSDEERTHIYELYMRDYHANLSKEAKSYGLKVSDMMYNRRYNSEVKLENIRNRFGQVDNL